MRRVRTNVLSLYPNYMVLFLVIVVIQLILNPFCLILLAGLAYVWYRFLPLNEDITWQPTGSLAWIPWNALDAKQRVYVLGGLTFMAFLAITGAIIQTACWLALFLALGHSLFHPVAQPDGELDQTEDVPFV